MTICIVDTSILVELLNFRGLASNHEGVVDEFAKRQQAGEEFLLPLAVLVETGNHVAHIPDGAARRRSADDFIRFASASLGGELPFTPTPLPATADIAAWLSDFPDHAMRGIGLADRSLIALWETHRQLHPQRRIYLWSQDRELACYDTETR
ncbi:MAG TPA: hypothetical protein VH165_28155 [Kofleriaceae bacterium]|nr:hypothetical protein [Kofleriaceae bacterium]